METKAEGASAVCMETKAEGASAVCMETKVEGAVFAWKLNWKAQVLYLCGN